MIFGDFCIDQGITPKAQKACPNLTDKHKKERVSFFTWILTLSALFIDFSDETQIDTNQNQPRKQWCGPKEVPRPRMVEQGPAQLTLWGVIGIGFRHVIIMPRQTLSMESYHSKCLQPSIGVLRERQKRAGTVLMQDNAPAHSRSKQYLRSRRVKTLERKWSANSPDANPIEQLWEILKDAVERRGPYGIDELTQFVQEEWDRISQDTIDNLVRSFRARAQKIVAMKGETIKPDRTRR